MYQYQQKGDSRIYNRTIALISHASKVMLKVIQHRLDIYMKQEMTIEQAGFTKGRGTRDQISNLRRIMERSTEYHRPIYMQSFQVEGPQNREISLFIGNTIGRFVTGTFQGGKTVSNSCYHVLQH